MVNWMFFITAGSVLNNCNNRQSCCGVNEVYKPPGSAPTCESTCDNLNALCLPDDQSVSGCFCIEDHVRDISGICIPKDKCPQKCGDPNEVWYPICNAPKCEQTCINWGQACQGNSHAGCFCGKGYARDSSGNCVQMESCRYTCAGDFEFLLSAASAETCTFVCTPEGKLICDENYQNTNRCVCLIGYVRGVDGKCIRIEDCQEICPAEEG